MAVEPAITDITYREILTSIIQRFVRLVGLPAALNIARRTPDLMVDDTGRVLNYDQNNPLVTITQLMDSYAAVFGDSALHLSRQALRLETTPEAVLHEVGLLTRVSPVKLLLVDDAVLFRESLVNLLHQQPDFTIVGQAGSMAEAVEQAATLHPALILMDFSLPDGTGLEATIQILAEHPEIKIVFLTVHEDDERLFSAIRAGARGYLFKNSHTHELIRTLRGVARGEAGVSRALAVRLLNEFARTPSPSVADPHDKTELTTREIEIVRELARGASNKEIAEKLVISENTVKNHVRNVLAKLHLRSRREIAKYARDHNLLIRVG